MGRHARPARSPGGPPPSFGRGGTPRRVRLLSTPTVAFGVAVVVMSAVAFGATQTRLAFRQSGPYAGSPCGSGCAAGAAVPDDRGDRVAPERVDDAPGPPVAAPPRPAPSEYGDARSTRPSGRPTAPPDPRPSAAPPPRGRPPDPVQGVTVGHATARESPTGFVATITIANHSDRPVVDWELRFRYPGAQVRAVWDARWQIEVDVVTVTPPEDDRTLPPGATLRIWLAAEGTPAGLDGCTFDGAPCLSP